MAIPVKTVEYRTGSMLANMGVGSSTQAVFKALELGILDLDELTRECNLQAVRSLTETESEILEVMTKEHENKILAGLLFRSVATIDFHKTNIFKKLGVNSHMQAGLIYLAAKKAGIISEHVIE